MISQPGDENHRVVFLWQTGSHLGWSVRASLGWLVPQWVSPIFSMQCLTRSREDQRPKLATQSSPRPRETGERGRG